MPRLTDPDLLHPAFRRPFLALLTECQAAGIPLQLFEGARTPFRQAELYAVGRAVGNGAMGKTKTRAKAWESYHQYAIAADAVFLVGGNWTWVEPKFGMWAEYRDRAAKYGLRSLSFEQPHVELPLNLSQVQHGQFPPDGGDHAWRDWIEQQAELWGQRAVETNGIIQPGAPAAMLTVGERGDVAG